MNTDKLTIFGDLNAIKIQSEKVLKDMTALWEAGNVRLLPNDLVLLNKLITGIKNDLNATIKFNHAGFSQITNEAVREKVGIK